MKQARPGEEGFGVALVEKLKRWFGMRRLGFEEMGNEFDGISSEEAA